MRCSEPAPTPFTMQNTLADLPQADIKILHVFLEETILLFQEMHWIICMSQCRQPNIYYNTAIQYMGDGREGCFRVTCHNTFNRAYEFDECAQLVYHIV